MSLIIFALLSLLTLSANVPEDTNIDCKATLSHSFCVDQARARGFPLACEYRCNCGDTRTSAGIQCKCQTGAPTCRMSADCWDEALAGTAPAGWCNTDLDCPQDGTYCNTFTKRCAAIDHFDYCHQHRCVATVLCTDAPDSCGLDMICADSAEFAGQKVCVPLPAAAAPHPTPKACVSAANCTVGRRQCKCRQGGRTCTCKEQVDDGPFYCDTARKVPCPANPDVLGFCPDEPKCAAFKEKCPRETCVSNGLCSASLSDRVNTGCQTSACDSATGLCSVADGAGCVRNAFVGKCTDGFCL